MTERTLDLRGLKCPLPVLRIRKALSAAAPEDVIIAECTDPLTQIDVPHLLRQTGDVLDSRDHRGELLTFRIRKGAR